MPALTTCTTCEFKGPHGFVGRVGGITYFHHGKCGYYSASGKTYSTLAKAWRAIRARYPDDDWRRGWDARILEDKPRKAERLLKAWQESATAGTQAERATR
jgi:hypothetical protein